MSQPQSTVLNGPSGELTMAFKDAAPHPQDTNKAIPPGGEFIQQQGGGVVRPPLQRNDSRVNLPPRPQFAGGNPQQFRPPPQQRPQFPGGGQIRPGPPLQRPLAPNQPLPPRPPIQNPVPRPATPFIRPQQPRPPGPPPVQQKPVQRNPSSEQSEPVHSDGILRTARSMSQSSNPDGSPVEARRVSIAAEEKRSDEPPSRPESRASAHMKIIQENPPDDAKAAPPKTLPLVTTPSPPPPAPEKKPEPPEITKTAPPKPSPKKPPKVPAKKEGDNDSGVDESTQGNEPSTNGDHSPRKSARNNSRLTTPTKNRSFSRGSRSPNLKSPDSTPSTPGGGEKRKLPMNKIQVGSAPSPNLKVVKSKIGSLANANYKPGGGHVKIETKKVDVSSAHSKIGAKNEHYQPSGGDKKPGGGGGAGVGGDKKIIHQKLQWSAKSKIGSLENATHKPKGGDKKIESVRLDFKEKAKPKVGSKDNMKHQPGGGDIKIETKKLNIKGESKIGSLDNMKHRPGGGDKKIFDDKDYLRQKSGLSNENNSVSGSQVTEEPRPETAPSRLSRVDTPRAPWKY